MCENVFKLFIASMRLYFFITPNKEQFYDIKIWIKKESPLIH